jgi:hypothetical protein
MVEHLLELTQKPRILYGRLHPQQEAKAAPTSKNLERLMQRLELRRWVPHMQDRLMQEILRLRQEVKFIEHLPKCYMCKMELQLDVERYLGTRTFWWICLENNQYLEQRYRGCPKERDYHIGNYWEQYNYYQKYGTCDVPGENTLQFILDRSKWAYKIYGRQIRTVRRLLHLLRTWHFGSDQEELLDEFYRIYNRLDMYDL